ncbi:uncharacterized protein M421DRAFT_285418 [Didymella exigua CBS 183.55]|uniref:Uncharacterized protein n=1 Tax=Didymella exigua CBS 183.55 TaxID=1150837 RepID=A0A6A5S3S5_9PLEO|nr:uncharacterized protein M421DRAFT_285418 [Didymella exigua CBS 183.55]KAF1932147.1 hypothetical protein M421DRAFT_285418 [Didymella exigua CBS 183.55]
MVHLFCTDGLIVCCGFWLLYSPLVAFCAFYSFLIPLYPTFVQEPDWEHRLEAGAMATDIERIGLQGRK